MAGIKPGIQKSNLMTFEILTIVTTTCEVRVYTVNNRAATYLGHYVVPILITAKIIDLTLGYKMLPFFSKLKLVIYAILAKQNRSRDSSYSVHMVIRLISKASQIIRLKCLFKDLCVRECIMYLYCLLVLYDT